MLISAVSPSNSLQICAYLPKRLGSMHKRLFQLCAQLRGQLAHLCFRQLGMTHGKLNAHTISQESLGKFNFIFFGSCFCCFFSCFFSYYFCLSCSIFFNSLCANAQNPVFMLVSANRVTIFVTIEGVLSSDKGLTIYLFF